MSEPSEAIAERTQTERDALAELVASDGWALFLKALDEQWGDAACIQQIDAALATVGRGDREAQEDTVTQIRAAARAVQGMKDWPMMRLAQLRKAAEPKGLFRRRA